MDYAKIYDIFFHEYYAHFLEPAYTLSTPRNLLLKYLRFGLKEHSGVRDRQIVVNSRPSLSTRTIFRRDSKAT